VEVQGYLVMVHLAEVQVLVLLVVAALGYLDMGLHQEVVVDHLGEVLGYLVMALHLVVEVQVL